MTMDEAWIHYFTPESNWQSDECTVAGESRSKMQTSAGEVLASVFWDMQVILFIDYLEKGRTINNKYYKALLVRLKEEITKKWPRVKKKKVIFHQNNAPCHKSIAMMAKLHEITTTPTLFSRSGLQWLVAVCRPQKNAPGKEIWLQWRSDIRNWGVFWGQRKIILQKKHWIVREALESVYHLRRRLLMNKVKLWLKVVVLLVRPRTYSVMCYLFIYIYIYIYTYTHTHTHVYIYIFVHIHVCAYTYIHTHLPLSLSLYIYI